MIVDGYYIIISELFYNYIPEGMFVGMFELFG